MDELSANILDTMDKQNRAVLQAVIDANKDPEIRFKDLKDAVKYDGDKLRFDLIPVLPLEELAKLYTVGAKKYADRNWEKGFQWTRCLAAMMRHMFAFCKGEDLDLENGCHHLSAVAFYCFAIMEFGRTHPEMDDRIKA